LPDRCSYGHAGIPLSRLDRRQAAGSTRSHRYLGASYWDAQPGMYGDAACRLPDRGSYVYACGDIAIGDKPAVGLSPTIDGLA